MSTDTSPIMIGFCRSQTASDGFNRLVRTCSFLNRSRRLRWVLVRRKSWHSGREQNAWRFRFRGSGMNDLSHARHLTLECISPLSSRIQVLRASTGAGRKTRKEKPKQRRRKKTFQRIFRRKFKRRKSIFKPPVSRPFQIALGT